MKRIQLGLIAFVVATAITATMDFTGCSMFSALPLLAITLVFWMISKSSRSAMGLKAGQFNYYLLAIFIPFILLGLAFLAAFLSGDYEIGEIKYFNILINSTMGILAVILTEEGFFRGWLWGYLESKGTGPKRTLIITSLMFTIWHISAVTSGTEYGLPLYQVPIYLISATFLGLIWGMFRAISGSVIIPAVYHAIWNALAYDLFGFGEKVGQLGITNTIVFGPEVGVLGIVLNGGCFFWLWSKHRHQLDRTPTDK